MAPLRVCLVGRRAVFAACVAAVVLLHGGLVAQVEGRRTVGPVPPVQGRVALHAIARRPAATPSAAGSGARRQGAREPVAGALPAAAAGVHFWAAEALQRAPVPVSAPDTTRLDGVVLSGLPLRLRLLVDATGRVVDVLPLAVASDDEAALPRLREMFVATAFIPGRRAGRDVPSRLDIELTAQTVLPGA